MHSCIFNHRLTCLLDGLYYLVLRLPERNFSGLLERCLLLPYSLYPPYGFFFFFQVLFQTPWPLGEKFRTLLRSWGSPFSSFCPTFSGVGSKVVGKFSDRDYDVFRKGALEMSVNLLAFSARAGFVCPFWSLQGFLRSCLWVVWSSHARLAAFSLGSSSLVIPALLGVFPSSWKDCSTIAKQCPRKSAPFLLFILSRGREVVDGVFPLPLTGFLVYLYFLMFYEEKKIKIEVIEECFSSVLWGFYYRLTLSRSDFTKWHTCYICLF